MSALVLALLILACSITVAFRVESVRAERDPSRYRARHRRAP